MLLVNKKSRCPIDLSLFLSALCSPHWACRRARAETCAGTQLAASRRRRRAERGMGRDHNFLDSVILLSTVWSSPWTCPTGLVDTYSKGINPPRWITFLLSLLGLVPAPLPSLARLDQPLWRPGRLPAPRHLDRPGDLFGFRCEQLVRVWTRSAATREKVCLPRVLSVRYMVYFILRLLRLRAGALGAIIIREKSQ